MVSVRFCNKARQAFFLCEPEIFDFLNCETKASKRFKCEHKMRLSCSEIKQINKLVLGKFYPSKKSRLQESFLKRKLRLWDLWSLIKIFKTNSFWRTIHKFISLSDCCLLGWSHSLQLWRSNTWCNQSAYYALQEAGWSLASIT